LDDCHIFVVLHGLGPGCNPKVGYTGSPLYNEITKFRVKL
jgi:hypothetical protein